MLIKSIAECSLLSTCIKLPPVFKTFALSSFEWPLKTGFTVQFQLATDLEKDVSQLKSENESLKRKHKVFNSDTVKLQFQVVL